MAIMVGARVSIKVNGKPQMREVVLGDGYDWQNLSLRQHFGIGDATSAIIELVVEVAGDSGKSVRDI